MNFHPCLLYEMSLKLYIQTDFVFFLLFSQWLYIKCNSYCVHGTSGKFDPVQNTIVFHFFIWQQNDFFIAARKNGIFVGGWWRQIVCQTGMIQENSSAKKMVAIKIAITQSGTFFLIGLLSWLWLFTVSNQLGIFTNSAQLFCYPIYKSLTQLN